MTNSFWDKSVQVQLGEISRHVPFSNFFGKNWFANIHSMLERTLEIKEDEKVLDIGGGSNPFARANVVTDAYLEDNSHRAGRAIPKDKKYVECFAEDLPFEDKEFDVVVSRHVFEHTKDPVAACKEMCRVGKRGFIETPSAWSEYFCGFSSHQWMISDDKGVLVFRRRPFIRNPFLNCLRWMEYSDRDFTFRWENDFRNIITTQFYWENEFTCRVEDNPGFDFNDPDQAAESHLDFALGALRYGGVPTSEIVYEVETALKLKPDWPIALNTMAGLKFLDKKFDEASELFQKAHSLEPEDEIYKNNSEKSFPDDPPLLKYLPPLPWVSGTPEENFLGINYYTFGNDELLSKQLNINEKEKVLDVCLTEEPFKRANIAVDLSFDKKFYGVIKNFDSQEKKQQITDLKLPFSDNEFDVVVCREVLAKINHPGEFCKEIQRVGKRGLIEVPQFFWDCVYGDPEVRWLCFVEDDVLVFKRKPFMKNMYKNSMVLAMEKFPEVKHQALVSARNITQIQLAWEGSFNFRVEEDQNSPFDYNLEQHAFLAHLDAAFHLCNRGCGTGALPHAEKAIGILPDHPDALNLLGVIYWSLREYDKGILMVEKAVQKNPGNQTLMNNLKSMRDNLEAFKMKDQN